MVSESSLLSSRLFGSTVNAAFGGVSATGVGTPELEVTQNGKPPPLTPCVAVQFGGRAGGVTPSKFSEISAGQGVAVGVAVGVGVAVAVAVGVGPHGLGVGVGVPEGVGVGVGDPCHRLNAPIRNRHPAALVVGIYSLTCQNVRSSTGSTSIAV